MNTVIDVRHLNKEFRFSVKSNKGIFRNLFNPEKKTIKAVEDISFSVIKGESLAFIGPNGAGKSTTIKMLTGILYPSSGYIQVAGFNPQSERKELAFRIGTVFGQRSQLIFNLPLRDSFELFGRLYELSLSRIKEKEEELIELFDLKDFADQPVRKLSLGQRMRSEIALSLLHEPEIIFLDEPTIGLDIIAKKKLRQTLKALNKDRGTTLFLTSHDVGDVEALCERTIVINHGKLVVDAPTQELSKEYLTEKRLKLEFKDNINRFEVKGAEVLYFEGTKAFLKIDTEKYSLNEVIRDIVMKYDLEDLDISNPELEDIIGTIYEKKQA